MYLHINHIRKIYFLTLYYDITAVSFSLYLLPDHYSCLWIKYFCIFIYCLSRTSLIRSWCDPFNSNPSLLSYILMIANSEGKLKVMVLKNLFASYNPEYEVHHECLPVRSLLYGFVKHVSISSTCFMVITNSVRMLYNRVLFFHEIYEWLVDCVPTFLRTLAGCRNVCSTRARNWQRNIKARRCA